MLHEGFLMLPFLERHRVEQKAAAVAAKTIEAQQA